MDDKADDIRGLDQNDKGEKKKKKKRIKEKRDVRPQRLSTQSIPRQAWMTLRCIGRLAQVIRSEAADYSTEYVILRSSVFQHYLGSLQVSTS